MTCCCFLIKTASDDRRLFGTPEYKKVLGKNTWTKCTITPLKIYIFEHFKFESSKLLIFRFVLLFLKLSSGIKHVFVVQWQCTFMYNMALLQHKMCFCKFYIHKFGRLTMENMIIRVFTLFFSSAIIVHKATNVLYHKETPCNLLFDFD